MQNSLTTIFTLFTVCNSLSTTSVKNTQKVNKFIQEAELKHGRVAMASTVTIPMIEIFNGNHQGIYELSSQPVTIQLSLLGIFACSEISQLLKAYEFPNETSNWFNMKDEHIPGEYSFDPLGFSNSTETFSEYKKSEIYNGRLAMLAAFGILSQELCTDKTVIDTFSGF